MDEYHARFFVSGAVVLAVVDQHVAGVHEAMLVARHAGDDGNSRKMLLRPGDLLRRGPFAERQAGENGRM